MKFINLEQGSPEWHAHRRNHANASEAGCVMNCSPWKPDSWLQLWRIKNGQDEIVQNHAMRRGIEREAITRQWASEKYRIDFQPAVVVDDDGWMSASLDGISPDGSVILEVKNTSNTSDTWKAALIGRIEPNYLAQVQEQLLVSVAIRCLFVVDNGIDTPIAIHVISDPEYQELLIHEWKRFWTHMTDFSPPETGANDITPMDGPEWAVAVSQYRVANVCLKDAEKASEEARKALVAMCGENHACQGCGLRVRQNYRRGSVEYSKVPELAGIDLNRYRKDGSVVWTINEIKG